MHSCATMQNTHTHTHNYTNTHALTMTHSQTYVCDHTNTHKHTHSPWHIDTNIHVWPHQHTCTTHTHTPTHTHYSHRQGRWWLQTGPSPSAHWWRRWWPAEDSGPELSCAWPRCPPHARCIASPEAGSASPSCTQVLYVLGAVKAL